MRATERHLYRAIKVGTEGTSSHNCKKTWIKKPVDSQEEEDLSRLAAPAPRLWIWYKQPLAAGGGSVGHGRIWKGWWQGSLLNFGWAERGWREIFKWPTRSNRSPDRKSVKLKQEVGLNTWSPWSGQQWWRGFVEESWKKSSSTLLRLSLKRTGKKLQGHQYFLQVGTEKKQTWDLVCVPSCCSRNATSWPKTTDRSFGSSLSSGSTAAAWGSRGGRVSGRQPAPGALLLSSSIPPSSSPPPVCPLMPPGHPT